MENAEHIRNKIIKEYKDESIFRIQIKDYREFQCMLADAENDLFDTIVVRDISCFVGSIID